MKTVSNQSTYVLTFHYIQLFKFKKSIKLLNAWMKLHFKLSTNKPLQTSLKKFSVSQSSDRIYKSRYVSISSSFLGSKYPVIGHYHFFLESKSTRLLKIYILFFKLLCLFFLYIKNHILPSSSPQKYKSHFLFHIICRIEWCKIRFVGEIFVWTIFRRYLIEAPYLVMKRLKKILPCASHHTI